MICGDLCTEPEQCRLCGKRWHKDCWELNCVAKKGKLGLECANINMNMKSVEVRRVLSLSVADQVKIVEAAPLNNVRMGPKGVVNPYSKCDNCGKDISYLARGHYFKCRMGENRRAPPVGSRALAQRIKEFFFVNGDSLN